MTRLSQDRNETMGMRTTFTGASLGVDAGGDPFPFVYGPRSARAYARIQARHAAVLAERDRMAERYRPVRESLRQDGGTLCEINTYIRTSYPDDWRILAPYHQLRRLGYDEIRAAATEDTDEYWDAVIDGSWDEPWEPCRTPREAFEKYGAGSDAA